MKALWTEPRVTFQGEFWQLEDLPMEPKPFQKPYPPAVVRRGQRPALRPRRAGWATASSAPGSRPPQFAEQVRSFGQALAEAGRATDSFPIAKRVYIGIDDDAERARNG